jgi:hypothetical protein
MSELLQRIDKKNLKNKLFRKGLIYGIIIDIIYYDENYDEIALYFDGKINNIPFVWFEHFIDEIID